MTKHKIQQFPKSRIATIDVCEMGKRKHHVTGLIELDVSKSRKKIQEYNKNCSRKISFTSWMISVISFTIHQHETSSAYLKGKNELMIFEDINVSVIVEKDLNDQKVPIPLLIEKANELSIEMISKQINDARIQNYIGC